MGPAIAPAISVAVPAFNCEGTLPATLESLIAQTYGDWEAIVVDDGSTDATSAVVERFAADDTRIRLHRQENKGVGGARNASIALARGEWMFFLDADDTIVPEAFEKLLAGLEATPGADAVLAGCQRVDADGRKLRSQLPGHHTDHFLVFARICAIVIHSCLVRTELVRRAGGFDESLVTCEDWDLWQRIARTGARFATISADVAVYCMRPGSASHDGPRMLQDGLLVIERGHGVDERMLGIESADLALPSEEGRDVARTYFACYAAGLEMALGRDARWVVDALGDGISSRIDPDGIAETLCIALADGRVASPGDWSSFPAEIHALCRDFVTALGDRLGDHWLAFGAQNALERMALRENHDTRPRRVGRLHLMELDVAGPPPRCAQLGPDTELVLCRVLFAGREIGDLEVPLADGALEARVLADAIVAAHCWELLGAFLEREVHPLLEVAEQNGTARVERDGLLLYDGPLASARPQGLSLHDRVGWTLFLQELWECPSMSDTDFYADAPRPEAPAAREVSGDAPVRIEIDEDLPSLCREGATSIDLALHVAGVPLSAHRCRSDSGTFYAHDLRREILVACGYELCRAVVREALVLAPAGASGSLRQRLRIAREQRDGEAIAPGATVVGRAAGGDGTTASRWLALPPSVAAQRLELARLDGDPISGPAADAEALLSAPLVLGRSRPSGPLADASLLRSLEFEQIFAAAPDPWDLVSPYERDKYDLTLSLVPRGSERAIELGCAEGAFSARLADRVGHLTAADLSFTALSRARKRCAGKSNVAFAQLDVFEGQIGGPFDLVVCSELLYYGRTWPALSRALEGIAAALEAGGHLLTVHANTVVDDPGAPGFDWDVPFGAAAIDEALRDSGSFDLRREIRVPAYRVQLWRRRGRRRYLPARRRRTRWADAAGPEEMPEFLPNGGEVKRQPPGEPPGAMRLPILMYHRVAPSGSEDTARYRLHPEAFEQQLALLRDQGYSSMTFDQWRVASDRRRPIPEKSVMITFDDGYADFPDHAQPLLAKYDLAATVFVVTDLVGGVNAWDEAFGERLELMDWEALRRLRDAGIEIGSHSSAHRPLVSLSPLDLAHDLCRSRIRLHEELGFPVRSFSYPYGLHDAVARSTAGAVGFHYGVATHGWHASFGEDLLTLPRLEIRGSDDLGAFGAKLAG